MATSITVVLNRGELGYDEVTKTAKVGDGITSWDNLSTFNKVDVIDGLSSSSDSSALSANQGKILNNKITSLQSEISQISTIDVIDNLTTQNSDAALSANQGYVLSSTKLDKSSIVDNLSSDSGTVPLSAGQGKLLKSYVDAKINTSAIIDDLVSGGSTVPLSAEQGKLLGDRVKYLEEHGGGSGGGSGSSVVVPVPSQAIALTYNGSEQSVTWNNYYDIAYSVSGINSATNAGTYTTIFTLVSGFEWSDGTTNPKFVEWTIGKANLIISSDETDVEIGVTSLSHAISINNSSSGAISAVSNDPSVVSVSVVGNSVTVTAVTEIDARTSVTISCDGDSNYNAAQSISIPIIVDLVSTTLNDNSWSVISKVVKAGKASNYWNVGDTKNVTLSDDKIDNQSIGGTYKVVVLGFDHNSEREGTNTMHFQFAKTSDGTKDIAFCDFTGAYAGGSGVSSGFCMNLTNVNQGGYTNSYMYKTILPQFLNVCPSELVNVMALAPKWEDNVGGNTNVETNISMSEDKIFLLAEWEIFGARTYANSYEQNYQQRYAYYANGNPTIRYNHQALSTACHWWERSVYASDATNFCHVISYGDANGNCASYLFGLAPGFVIS